MKILTAVLFILAVLHHKRFTCEAIDGILWDSTVRLVTGPEFLFVASISLKNYGHDPKFPVHICSGVLITKKHVITSTHCIKDVKAFKDVVVKVGYKDLRYTAKYGIKYWTSYKLWAKANDITIEPLEHDISILKLAEKAEWLIDPAKITNSSNKDFDGKRVQTVVWGPHKKDRALLLLKVADLDVISYKDCMKDLNSSPLMLRNHTIDKTYMCTHINLGAVLEDIDSASPLLVNDKELIAINDPTYLQRRGIHAPTNLNFHIGLEYYRPFITDVTTTEKAKWWQIWKGN